MSASPVKLIVHGARGRMGQALLRLAAVDPGVVVVGAVARTLDGTAIPGPAAEHLSCDPSLTWTLTRRPEEPLPPPRPPT